MRVVSSGTIYYYEDDMLGSARTMVQAGQTSPCFDADFLPYGQEVDYTSTCGTNYRFEGKERDLETGDDNFGARYYRSNLGRWLSADWSAVPAPVPYANLTNPQTLNLYAMVSDNPETFADLDGHDWKQVWHDLKTFADSISVQIGVGVGLSIGTKEGPFEARAGIAAFANIQGGGKGDTILKLSRSTEVGAHLGIDNGPGVGKTVTAEKTWLRVHPGGATGPEDPGLTTTSTGETGDVTASGSADKKSISVEAGLGPAVHGEVSTTSEGLKALSDIVPQLKDEFVVPPPPPPSSPPQPPRN